ncbi:hypothetical protein K7432_000889 [Basidiobolus ranarum]|uniref:C2H2-type domain-containing protein n=1 Tax=Basidiobolus ranarum TaxID=34480 RepID=A0ABR2WAE6_9FUNG
MQVADRIHETQFPRTWYSCPFGNCSCKFKTYDFVKRHVLNHHMNTFSRCDSDYCETCLSHSKSTPHVRSDSPNAVPKRKRSPDLSTASPKKSFKQSNVRDSTSPSTLTVRTESPVSETPNTPKTMYSISNSPKATSPSLPSIRTIFNMNERAQQYLPSPISSTGQPGLHGYMMPSLPSLEELSFTSVAHSHNPWHTSSTIYPCQVAGCNMKFDRMEHLNRHLLYHPPEDSRSYGPNSVIRPPM